MPLALTVRSQTLHPAVHGAATPQMAVPWKTLEQNIEAISNGRIN